MLKLSAALEHNVFTALAVGISARRFATTQKEITAMPTAADILMAKGHAVHSTDPGTTVLEATQKMNQQTLGSLVVLVGNRLAGMFTERDVLRRVVGELRNPAEVKVGEVMTTDVICVSPDTDIEDVAQIMKEKRIRHVPVCDDDGKLHGVISIGDVNAYYTTRQEETITFLSDYIYGRA
jgi:CBS domain-containing protein